MARHGAAQHSAAQHSTAQHSTAQHSTAQHSMQAEFQILHSNLLYTHCTAQQLDHATQLSAALQPSPSQMQVM